MFARRLIHLMITSLLVALAVVPAAAAPPDKTITRTTNVFLGAFSPEGARINVFRVEGSYVVCVSTPEEFLGCGTLADLSLIHI